MSSRINEPDPLPAQPAVARARSRRRTLLWAARIVLWAAVVVALLLVHRGLGDNADAAYAGTPMGGAPAPAFQLTNQRGQTVSLAGLGGRAILLTFLDGHCKDVCPTTMKTMAEIQQRLGDDADRLAVVAISVDPWLDQVGQPALIAQEPGNVAPAKWNFLTGTLDQLQPVWDGYHVSVVQSEIGQFGVNGEHDTGFFLIDSHGREQLYIQSTAPLSTLVQRTRDVIHGDV